MKKGAIQIETIIVIILALLALVIIAAAFTGGFNQLWNKLLSFQPEKLSMSDAQTACNNLCGKPDFCGKGFTIIGQETLGLQKCQNIVSCQMTCP